MADNGIFATTAEVNYAAGSGKSSVSSAESYVNSFMTKAESYINATCMTNYSDTYTSLNVDKKGILKKWAVALAAFEVVRYDDTGYSSPTVWQTILDTLRDEALMCETQMKEIAKRDFVSSA